MDVLPERPQGSDPTGPRKGKRWLRRGIVAAAVAAVLLPAATVLAIHLRTDVPDAHPFHADIGAIIQAGIGAEDVDTGTGGLQFGPGLLTNRGRQAQWFHLGLPRVAYATSGQVVLSTTTQDVAILIISVGGATGGTQFVKLDAAITAYVADQTGCPCYASFHLAQDGGGTSFGHVLLPEPNAGCVGTICPAESGAISWVVAVPSGSTQVFRLRATKVTAGFPGSITGYGTVSAIAAPFGASGGNTIN